MKIVFVTGGIGSGKSAVCKVLSNIGIPVYDSDSRTKRLYDTDPDLIPSLETALEVDSLRSEDGKLDKRMLSGIIFSDKVKLQRLEDIVHPAVLKDFMAFAGQYENTEVPFVVMESALVLQKPLFDDVADCVVLVDAPLDVRIERACRRDSSAREAIIDRINNQIIDSSKADIIIVNDADFETLEQRVMDAFRPLLKNSYICI